MTEDPDTTTTYRGHIVTVTEDGRWRYGPFTFETQDDARYYLDNLPERVL